MHNYKPTFAHPWIAVLWDIMLKFKMLVDSWHVGQISDLQNNQIESVKGFL